MGTPESTDAGNFSEWLDHIQEALRGERSSDVPCGDCTACCTSSQFIHIAPEETDTLAHIPGELLFAAPGLPAGHVLLGYDERGHCPMLVDGRCSIYDHRPGTCRTYDCRIFPAAGVDLEDDSKVLIGQRARRWRFSHPSRDDRARHHAVRAAASYLQAHPELFPDGSTPVAATPLAVHAVEVHARFLAEDGSGTVEPDPEAVRVELRRRPDASRPLAT